MSTILLLLLLLAMVVGWYGHRMGAIYIVLVSLMLAIFWFANHATDKLNINI